MNNALFKALRKVVTKGKDMGHHAPLGEDANGDTGYEEACRVFMADGFTVFVSTAHRDLGLEIWFYEIEVDKKGAGLNSDKATYYRGRVSLDHSTDSFAILVKDITLRDIKG